MSKLRPSFALATFRPHLANFEPPPLQSFQNLPCIAPNPVNQLHYQLPLPHVAFHLPHLAEARFHCIFLGLLAISRLIHGTRLTAHRVVTAGGTIPAAGVIGAARCVSPRIYRSSTAVPSRFLQGNQMLYLMLYHLCAVFPFKPVDNNRF